MQNLMICVVHALAVRLCLARTSDFSRPKYYFLKGQAARPLGGGVSLMRWPVSQRSSR